MLPEFTRLTIPAVSSLMPRLRRAGGCYRLCDYTPGVLALWRDILRYELAVTDDAVYIRTTDGSGTYYLYPLVKPGREAQALDALDADCRARDDLPAFCNVPEEKLETLTARYPNAVVRESRDWCDYLYQATDIINLPGRHYSGQRNHLHRFTRVYGEAECVPLCAGNVDEAISFLNTYAAKIPDDDAGAKREAAAVAGFLREGNLCGQTGLILRASGKTVGFSVGEVIGDTLFVHIEKADDTVPGAYQTLVNRYAAMYPEATFINREEDCGDSGLRQSKLSYRPVTLLTKYVVCPNNNHVSGNDAR